MNSITIECLNWHPHERNSLRGFATFRIRELRMVIEGVAVHESHGIRWAQLPARPLLGADGELMRGARGKVRYALVFRFDSEAVERAFSAAALKALDRYLAGHPVLAQAGVV